MRTKTASIPGTRYKTKERTEEERAKKKKRRATEKRCALRGTTDSPQSDGLRAIVALRLSDESTTRRRRALRLRLFDASDVRRFRRAPGVCALTLRRVAANAAGAEAAGPRHRAAPSANRTERCIPVRERALRVSRAQFSAHSCAFDGRPRAVEISSRHSSRQSGDHSLGTTAHGVQKLVSLQRPRKLHPSHMTGSVVRN